MTQCLPVTKTAAECKTDYYLSVVVTSRNDDHGGAAMARTQSFLDSLAEQCERLEFPVELIFVDWNPPSDRPLLQSALKRPDGDGQLKVRFIEVPPELHRELAYSDEWPMFQMIAKNVGIRRSTGRFVLATNIDIIFSEELMRFLSEKCLDENAFYVTDRHDLGVSSLPPGLFGSELMKYANAHLVRINYRGGTVLAGEAEPPKRADYLHTNACGDFTLMARSAWDKIRGYPEYQLYSIHIDGLALFAAREIGIRQRILKNPLHVYHIEHGNGWSTNRQKLTEHPSSLDFSRDLRPMYGNMMKNFVPFSANEDDWGFADEALWESDFSGHRCREEQSGIAHARDRYSYWLELHNWRNRNTNAIRQTPFDLSRLEETAKQFDPGVILAIGGCGLTLRSLLNSSQAAILSFNQRGELDSVEPRVIEKGKLQDGFDLSELSAYSRSLLVYLNAEELRDESSVSYFLAHIADMLPADSLVIVDNVWFSPQRLHGIAQEFLKRRIEPRRNPLRDLDLFYGDYHQGGSLIGPSGVKELLPYLNARLILLETTARGNRVWFTPSNKGMAGSGYDANFREEMHLLRHRPLHQSLIEAFDAMCDNLLPGEETLHLIDNLERLGMAPELLQGAKALCRIAEGNCDAAVEILSKNRSLKPGNLNADIWHDLSPLVDNGKNKKPGLTLFTTAKPFRGDAAKIQESALHSWTLMSPRPNIFLIGDEEGAAEIALKFGITHLPDVIRDEYGVPLLSSLFTIAHQHASTSHLAYVNADILFVDGFMESFNRVFSSLSKALIVGRRREICLPDMIDFNNKDWKHGLRVEAEQEGFTEKSDAMDYFIFPSGLWPFVPPFTIGRLAWDNWLIAKARSLGADIVDASECILALHLSHDYNHTPGGRQWIWTGPESLRNRCIAEEDAHTGSINDAEWQLTKSAPGLIRSTSKAIETRDAYKARRFAWLIRQIERFFDADRPDMIEPLLEELVSRNFPEQQAIAELRTRFETRFNKKLSVEKKS